MKLWLISQNVNNNYDAYDSAVVAAETEIDAKHIHPDGGNFQFSKRTWCWVEHPNQISVKYLGEADASIGRGVVCASFNAG